MNPGSPDPDRVLMDLCIFDGLSWAGSLRRVTCLGYVLHCCPSLSLLLGCVCVHVCVCTCVCGEVLVFLGNRSRECVPPGHAADQPRLWELLGRVADLASMPDRCKNSH